LELSENTLLKEVVKLRYFIDGKEVSEQEYQEKMKAQIYILITENIEHFLNSEEKKIFDNLSEFEKQLAYHMVSRREFNKYYGLNQQELRNYRFNKER
jgi:hypothetical protein